MIYTRSPQRRPPEKYYETSSPAHGRCAARAFCYRRLCSAARARRAFPPAVEKPPSPEAVNEWESAVFIARANGAALFAWRIVSSDGTALYNAAAAPEYFPGLRVQGADTDTLTLLDIPSSLNDWQVECLFTDDAGEKNALGTRVAHGLPRRSDRVAGADAHAGRDSHPGPSPTPEITPSPEPTEIPTASPSPAPETPVPTAAPAPAATAPLSRRAVLGVFAGLVALALLLGALSLKVRGGAHSAHRHR